MSKKRKCGFFVLLISPFLFVLVEYLWGVIDRNLFVFLFVLYLLSVPLLLLFIKGNKK